MQTTSFEIHGSKLLALLPFAIGLISGAYFFHQLFTDNLSDYRGILAGSCMALFLLLGAEIVWERITYSDHRLNVRYLFNQRTVNLSQLVYAERLNSHGLYSVPNKLLLKDQLGNKVTIDPEQFRTKDMAKLHQVLDPYIFITRVDKNF